jgi:hypothetical protein
VSKTKFRQNPSNRSRDDTGGQTDKHYEGNMGLCEYANAPKSANTFFPRKCLCTLSYEFRHKIRPLRGFEILTPTYKIISFCYMIRHCMGTKFHENPSNRSRDDTGGQTDRHHEVNTGLYEYANAPKNRQNLFSKEMLMYTKLRI